MTTMRAVRYDRYGPPDVLYVGAAPKPLLRNDSVLVRVHATSVMGGELFGREGKIRLISGNNFPKGIGADFTGEITEVGAGVNDLSVGEGVWGILPRDQYVRGRFGSAAEFVCVPAQQVSRAPGNVDLIDAAALPGVAATALIGLRDKGRLRAGERLLVRGATGGVGNVAVQLGRHLGAHITALASRKNLALARDLGASRAFDYRTTRVDELGKFDLIFDTVGTELGAYRKLQTQGGRMVAAAMNPDAIVGTAVAILASTVFGPHRIRFFSAAPRREILSEVAQLVEAGSLKPLVDTVYPMDKIADAHRTLAAGGTCGRQVIKVI